MCIVHRDLCVWTLYHKHMIVSRVSHQAVQALTQREKRVIRSSWYPCFPEVLLCWDTTHKIPTVTAEFMQQSGYIDGIFCIILDFKTLG